MALKDKLMTLEDFKAVRDVDVASNSAQFTEIKADLDNMQADIDNFTGMSDSVKEALLDCFTHVAWAESNGKIYYNTLRKVLYEPPTPLKKRYLIQEMDFERSSFGLSNVYGTPRDASTIMDYTIATVYEKDYFKNVIRSCSLFPCTGGRITAKSGYKVKIYEFSDIGYGSTNYNSNDELNGHGRIYCLNSVDDQPQWVLEYRINNPNCKYILIQATKESGYEWQVSELSDVYGNVFTAMLTPAYGLFDIAEFVNNKAYKKGAEVYSGYGKYYLEETNFSNCAIMKELPIRTGTIRSADASKYQIVVYQMDSYGAYIQDTANPHGVYNDPAWATEYILTNHNISGICVAFKKLNGAFTEEELANMVGTVFTYSKTTS